MATEQASFVVVRFSQELGEERMSDLSAFSKNGSLGDRIYSLWFRHNVEFVAINPPPTGNR